MKNLFKTKSSVYRESLKAHAPNGVFHFPIEKSTLLKNNDVLIRQEKIGKTFLGKETFQMTIEIPKTGFLSSFTVSFNKRRGKLSFHKDSHDKLGLSAIDYILSNDDKNKMLKYMVDAKDLAYEVPLLVSPQNLRVIRESIHNNFM